MSLQTMREAASEAMQRINRTWLEGRPPRSGFVSASEYHLSLPRFFRSG
jgi:hypothetical protein